MKKYKWILFDADHTLFDFDKASEEALSEVLIQNGSTWEEGMYADYKRINMQCWHEHETGKIDRNTLVYERFSRYFEFRQLNLDPVQTQKKYLQRLGAKPYLMPGAEDILAYLEGNVKLGYITNGLPEVQRPRMEMIGWEKKFEVIVIAGEVGHSKPQSAYFKHVDNLIGTPDPHDVLVVGDSLTADIGGATAFGYRSCWYNPENASCNVDPEPDYTIAHLSEIKKVLSTS